MITDSFFEQGVTHEVCEDYAVHGDDYAILADGCSNGGVSIHTDWGARLLCKAAEEHMARIQAEPTLFMQLVMNTALTQPRAIANLPVGCLTATLLTLCQTCQGNDGLIATIFGDGVVGGLRKDKTWDIRVIEYQPGGTTGQAAPYYPKYKLLEEEDRWVELFGDKYLVTTYHGNLTFPSNLTMEQKERVLSLEDPFEYWFFDKKIYDFAFIASDGIQSFYEWDETSTSRQQSRIGTPAVLGVLLDILSFQKDFLRLQRGWAFKQDKPGTFKRRGWHNADDVSMAGIYMGD